ncbi:MAG: hypothetical protein K5908_02020 [Erysipelotrichaceae bacterium]|jgi:hypothetical protein|nr:hypothetical protein [Erysipelotrichaceae bacterium]
MMKKAEKLNDLHVGQIIYTDESGKQSFRVKMLEDKLVPYIVTSDNRCHCLYKGIWFKESGS